MDRKLDHSSLGLKWLLGPVASVTMVLKWLVIIMLMSVCNRADKQQASMQQVNH